MSLLFRSGLQLSVATGGKVFDPDVEIKFEKIADSSDWATIKSADDNNSFGVISLLTGKILNEVPPHNDRALLTQPPGNDHLFNNRLPENWLYNRLQYFISLLLYKLMEINKYQSYQELTQNGPDVIQKMLQHAEAAYSDFKDRKSVV